MVSFALPVRTESAHPGQHDQDEDGHDQGRPSFVVPSAPQRFDCRVHHVTSIASGAQSNNDFFTKTLGLRRIKKTVNFDAPEVYHLYYGDEAGTPGTVMTYFPFPNARRGRPGTGEVGLTGFAVPQGSRPYWQERLAARGVTRTHLALTDDGGLVMATVVLESD